MSDDSDSDFFLDEDDSPKKKTPKKSKPKEFKVPKAANSSPKKATPKKKDEPATDINAAMSEEDRNVFVNIDKALTSKKAAIEDIYQKKTQLEHILLRPETYIGSVEYTEKAPMWVYDPEQEKIVTRDISFVPGLYKIFDEILVNAADNKQRDPKMSMIKVDINKEKNTISVWNNGKGIPVVLHKVEKVYVPELIFGTLLTSSNYDDSEKKVTGGRNGYGAKLCNIFSTEFTLETSSKEYKSAFKQTWINNMTKDKDPQIVKSTIDDYTKVTFKPDLAKFKMKELDDDIIHLMMRRAFDVAGSTRGLKVYLNGNQVPVNGFKQYVELYTKELGDDQKVVYETVNNRWEVAMTVSDNGFKQVSFVNSIATMKGGRHVDYVADQVVSKMKDVIVKKVGKSNVQVKPFQIKSHMWLFINCLIENPTFDSQTKETMTLQSKSFGSKCDLSEKFIKGANNCGVVDAVLTWVKFKQQEELSKKQSGKKTTKLKGIPKLEDANDAGTKNSHLCTLILTEGDSAKTLAVSGLAVVGRDRYGIFPLRGKLLNVREGNIKQVAENHEINALIRIIGLQYKKKYETEEDFKTLRYGSVMIMADQDQDGSHIKGLVINFIHANWPSLIKRNFVEQFITPIVKCIKGKEELSFFSLPEYREWKNNTPNSDKWRVKYYKGLGTSTSKEAKEYFSDMVRHRIKFQYGGPDDDTAVDMAFSKKKVEERKDWLTKWMAEKKDRRSQGLEEEYLYNKDTRTVSYKDFINKELVLFSNTDNERSIPCLVDGLKPGQRKVVFSCFKRADKREVKVAQLAGAVGELSAYHHGEASLMGTIVNLAQDFVGSNNINLLLPIGQFGTRLQGGKDSASPRYIFTKLNPVTRHLFPVADDHVLRFLFEDNQRIEPEWYCPIIPTVLVNGATGIGTAWSTNIPNYNPREVVENMKRLIKNEQQKALTPWYKGFRGEVVKLDASRFVVSGEVSILSEDVVEITELPIKTWTQSYKESVLEPLMEAGEGKGDKKKSPIIADFKEYHTDTTVRFVIRFVNGKLREAEREGLHKVLKLQTVLNTTSMVLFDSAGCLRKFNSPEEICSEFFETRKQKYIDRKAYMEGMLRAHSSRLSNQARFIMAKIEGKIIMENKKKAAIIDQLVKMKFDPDPVKKWNEEQKQKQAELYGEEETESVDEEENGKEDITDKKMSDYDYLVGMALIKLSEEEKNKLLKESNEKLAELMVLEKKTWAEMWENDLELFLQELKRQEDREKADRESAIQKKAGEGNKEKGKMRGAAKNIQSEIYPSKEGIRIAPYIDTALKEKYEKQGQPKAERAKKEPKEPKTPKEKKEKTPKKAPETKSPFEKNDKKKTKKNEWNSDMSSDSDEENLSADLFKEDEDADDTVYVPKASRTRNKGRKSAASDGEDIEETEKTGDMSKASKSRKRKKDNESDNEEDEDGNKAVHTPKPSKSRAKGKKSEELNGEKVTEVATPKSAESTNKNIDAEEEDVKVLNITPSSSRGTKRKAEKKLPAKNKKKKEDDSSTDDNDETYEFVSDRIAAQMEKDREKEFNELRRQSDIESRALQAQMDKRRKEVRDYKKKRAIWDKKYMRLKAQEAKEFGNPQACSTPRATPMKDILPAIPNFHPKLGNRPHLELTESEVEDETYDPETFDQTAYMRRHNL